VTRGPLILVAGQQIRAALRVNPGIPLSVTVTRWQEIFDVWANLSVLQDIDQTMYLVGAAFSMVDAGHDRPTGCTHRICYRQ
jgi:hypothetical protein